jgi:hypothetical protein
MCFMAMFYENAFIVAGKLNTDPEKHWNIFARNQERMEKEMEKDWKRKQKLKKKRKQKLNSKEKKKAKTELKKKAKTQEPMKKECNEKLLKTLNAIKNMESCLHMLLQNYIYKKEDMQWDGTPEYTKWDSERYVRMQKYYLRQPKLVKAWYTFILKKIEDSKLITRLQDNEDGWQQYVEKWYDKEYYPELQPDVLLPTLTTQITMCKTKISETKLDSHAFVLEYNDVELLWKTLRQLDGSLWVCSGWSDAEDDYEYHDEDDIEDTRGANILNLTNSSNNPYVLNFAF